jgi:hypothetical protein
MLDCSHEGQSATANEPWRDGRMPQSLRNRLEVLERKVIFLVLVVAIDYRQDSHGLLFLSFDQY